MIKNEAALLDLRPNLPFVGICICFASFPRHCWILYYYGRWVFMSPVLATSVCVTLETLWFPVLPCLDPECISKRMKPSFGPLVWVSCVFIQCSPCQYRWVPPNPNMDNPNSQLIQSLMEITHKISHVICLLNSKCTKFKRIYLAFWN